jgi:nucleotide-binding universal stress UspA family protein
MLRYRNRNKLQEETERLSARGVRVEAAFLAGAPAAEVVKCASRHAAGLIVVSSLGQLHPSRWLVGSVAEQMAQTAPVPVLVVRKPQPFMDWLKKRKALRVVIGHDFSDSADAAVAWVAALNKLAPCRITIVHLWSTQIAREWLEVGIESDRKGTLVETHRFLAEALRRRCKAALGTARFELQVRAIRSCTASRLISFAKQQNADLIVVGTNQKGTLRRLCLGSVSRSVLREASSSVACVPMKGMSKAPPSVL